MIIRKLLPEELKEALSLVWDVFSRFDAPDMEPQGILVFRDFIELNNIEKLVDSNVLTFTGAFAGGKLLGVLAMRGPAHISLLFVDPDVHRRGIARALFEEAKKETSLEGHRIITVNSSPYGVSFYRRLGFVPLEAEKEVNGMLITPMQFDLGSNQADG
jgi:GNAT superfamily N-acetyltransferase